jgi:hypothetical protein
MSIEHRLSKTGYGKEIAHLQRTLSVLKEASALCNATQVLKDASKLLSSFSPTKSSEYSPMAAAAATIQPDIDNLTRLATDRLLQADIDNCNIYMEAIPLPSDLPEIRAQTMVKRDLPMPPEMLIPRVKLFEWENDPARFSSGRTGPTPSAPSPPTNYPDDDDDGHEDGPYNDDFLTPPPPPPGYDFDGGVYLGEDTPLTASLGPPPPPAYDLIQPLQPPPAYPGENNLAKLERTDSDLARELQSKFDMED